MADVLDHSRRGDVGRTCCLPIVLLGAVLPHHAFALRLVAILALHPRRRDHLLMVGGPALAPPPPRRGRGLEPLLRGDAEHLGWQTQRGDAPRFPQRRGRRAVGEPRAPRIRRQRISGGAGDPVVPGHWASRLHGAGARARGCLPPRPGGNVGSWGLPSPTPRRLTRRHRSGAPATAAVCGGAGGAATPAGCAAAPAPRRGGCVLSSCGP
mmetsp:Transcript_39287/g.113618  ORF Transcript_39287/g.113618 Transcript_39287/m.113618 type:complete len:210 (-) Transcript_39287:343-972(-)